VDKQRAAFLMFHAIDGDATLKANAHATEWPAQIAVDRTSKLIDALGHDRRRDSRAVVNRNTFVVYG